MTTYLRDTFSVDPSGTELTLHTGETGATWSVIGGTGATDAVLTAANRLRFSTPLDTIYKASAVLPGTPYMLDVDFHVETNGSGYTPILHMISSGTDGYRLAKDNGGIWRFFRTGDFSTLGQFAQTLADHTDYHVHIVVEPAAHRYTLYIDTLGANHKIGPIVDTTWAPPTAIGLGVQSVSSSADDLHGIHIDNLIVVDWAATQLTITGPATGAYGVPTDLTVTPDGPFTGTPTISDASGGSFSIPTWTAEQTAKAVPYTPATAGAKTITPSASVPFSPATFAFTAVVGGNLTSAYVCTSGNVMVFEFGAAVTAATSGATWKKGGVSQGALGKPLVPYGNALKWAAFPLAPTLVAPAVDDFAGSPSFVTTGTWGVWDTSNSNISLGTGYPLNNQLSNSVDHSATCTWTLATPTPGRYRVSATIRNLEGPDRTTAAVYTVNGGGAPVAFTIDQTARQPWHRPDFKGLFTDLGWVTVTASTTTITLSNSGTAGTRLVADAVRMEIDQGQAVSGGDVVTVSFPQGTITTTAGQSAAVIDHAVPLIDDTTLMPFDATAARHMGIGYNLDPPDFNTAAAVFANRALARGPWHVATGAATVDPVHGELATIAGTVKSTLFNGQGDGDTTIGLKSVPTNTTVTTLFHYHTTDGGISDRPTVFLSDPGAGVTFDAPALTYLGSDEWRVVQNVTYPPFVPLATGDPVVLVKWSEQLTYGVELRTTSLITAVRVFTSECDPASLAVCHPALKDRVHGRGIVCVRTLDLWGVNSGNAVNVADLPDPADAMLEFRVENPGTTSISISRVDPILTADRDEWIAAVDSVIGYVRVTTAAPHGLTEGQCPDVFTVSNPAIPVTFTSDWGGTIQLSGHWCAVLDATTVIMECDHSGGSTTGGAPTIATGRATTGIALGVGKDQGVPAIWHAKIARDLVVGLHIPIPHLLTDAAITAVATTIRDNTDVGQTVWFELSNEHWNSAGRYRQSRWFTAKGHSLKYRFDNSLGGLDVRDGSEYYAYRANQMHNLCAAVFAADSRSDRTADLVRGFGTQSGGNAVTRAICNCAARFDFPVHAVWGDTYQDILPVTGGFINTVDELNAAFDKLDIDGHIDILAMSTFKGGRQEQIASHYAILNDVGSYGTRFASTRYESYEGGLQDPVIYGVVRENNRLINLGHAIGRHPRMMRWRLANDQMLGQAGCKRLVIYALDDTGADSGRNQWFEYLGDEMLAGKGDGSDGLFDNRTQYWDHSQIVSPIGLATRQWAASSGGVPLLLIFDNSLSGGYLDLDI